MVIKDITNEFLNYFAFKAVDNQSRPSYKPSPVVAHVA